jgi:hypothetical protein
MKKLALRFAFASTIALAFALSSCSKDEAAPDAPQATAPTAVTNVGVGAASDITFAITIPGGYQSSEVTAIGGTATKKSEPAAGEKSGSVVVTFTAAATTGAGSVTLTVTDKNAKSVISTAVISVDAILPTEISAPIAASTTWKTGTQYILKGNIYVQSGAELTIEPGVVIFGDKVTKGALIVSRGAKIHATGTATNPIVFTSSAPSGFRNYGDWGGVVLLGKAANNQSENQQIEGISAPTGDNGLYGGAIEDDNSGELQYARIEFAGIALSTDNELNGLTFGSVGSGTKVDHIQVSYSGDDSYEWFGGSVNTTYLIAYKGWDDEFDTDFGYRGYNQFLVSYRDPNIADKSGSNGFESDNNAQGDTKTPQTAATFANVTFFGPYMYAGFKAASSSDPTKVLDNTKVSSNYKRGAHIRRNSALKVYNSVFAGANIDGILFDKASADAVFKGNYVGRITGSLLPAPIANDVAAAYDATNFATENILSSPKDQIDLTTIFAGSTNNLWTLTAPTALLAAGSPLIANPLQATLPAFPAGFGFDTSVNYIGAFNATDNWATASWTNYDPNSTVYK